MCSRPRCRSGSISASPTAPASGSAPPDRHDNQDMSRRSLTLLIATLGVIAALAVAVLIPVPYVILGPGPTLNTLGQDSSGKPLITITGHPTYPTNGHLNMVTVGFRGGPRIRAVRSRADPAAGSAAGHPADDRLAAGRGRRGADRAAHPVPDPGGRGPARGGLPRRGRAQARGRDHRRGR